MASQSTSPSWLDRPLIQDPAKLFTVQNALIILILALALLSRFADLGQRVMSHDEVNHVVPSYDLYQGKGYRHDPITHGPFQFHVVALSYFLFGDNDFTSRVPAAAFSTAAILFIIIAFRRYLGRSGALVAGVLFLISPYMLFYGRYTRNEAFIELVGVVLLYGMLRYLERGDRLAMFLVTLATVLHFTIKETAFIYTAQALVFLFFIFLVETRRAHYRSPGTYNRFLMLMFAAMLLVLLALGLGLIKADIDSQAAQVTQTSTEEVETEGQDPETPAAASPSDLFLYGELAAVAAASVLALLGLFTLARELSWAFIKRLRSFSLIILITTLILPMLSPLVVNMFGWDPLDYTSTTSMLRTGAFVAGFFVLAAVIGLWWNPITWLQHAFTFYAIFTVLYTTFFTNGNGFFTGIVGSLGYWLSQQGVERGSQPRYYYALIQMPVYEFIGYFGAILAIYFGIRFSRFNTLPGYSPALAPHPEQDTLPITGRAEPDPAQPLVTEKPEDLETAGQPAAQTRAELDHPGSVEEQVAAFYSVRQPLPVLGLLLYWSFTSLLAYSLAGERMPWLTVHITLPFLMVSGWGLGFLIDTTDWKRVAQMRGLLAVLLLPVFFASLASGMATLLGTQPPFQGSTLEQLQSTSRFLLSVIGTVGSLEGFVYLLRGWEMPQLLRLGAAAFFILLALLTARAAYRASFINYDYAYEYLVYAHAAPGPKQVLRQIEEISQRTTGGKSIQVAYSSDMLYPYWWYLRDYPNYRWYQTNPTRDLREFPIVIAGEDVFSKIEPIVEDNFIRYDYMRLWWPNQDYYNLSLERVLNALRSPQLRSAVFQIWLNRDYTQYAEATNQPQVFKPESWSPGARMRVYIRNDIAAQIWEYGASPAAISPEQADPYADQIVQLAPVQVAGSAGSEPGQFQAPRGIKVAPDGTLYVADSHNHRIQHLAADGTVLHTWGSFGDANSGSAPGGTFNEPWDVAVAPDGSVYVSDTWNHRIQKFTADGQFISMFGYFGQAENPDAFWGPRGLAVDADGRVYVVDTGNKRVAIFDENGTFVSQFGGAGFELGQFEEPVGIALDADGNVYITDTWNQRVQVLAPSADRQFFTPLRAWDIAGWQGESLDNKPFLAVSPVNGHVFVTDPEEPRVLEFDAEGTFIRGWGEYSTTAEGFGLASGVTVTQDGDVWISDAGNNWLLRFEVLQ